MRSPFWSASWTHRLTSRSKNKRSGASVTSQETTWDSETHFSTSTSSIRYVSWLTLHLPTLVLLATPSGPYPIFAKVNQLRTLIISSVPFRPLQKFLSRQMHRRSWTTSAGQCRTSLTKVGMSVSLSSCKTTSCHAWFSSYATSKWSLRYLAFVHLATCSLQKTNMLKLQLIRAYLKLSSSSLIILRKQLRRKFVGRSQMLPPETLSKSRNASKSVLWTGSSVWCRIHPLISRVRPSGACQTQRPMQRPIK